MTEPARVVFVHLTKTGGTTLRWILRRIYRDRYLRIGPEPAAALATVGELAEAERERIRAVAGHMAYGVHAHFPGSWTTVTLVRHPVERILSHYGHALRDPDAPLHAEVASGSLGLREYVATERSRLVNNGQVRLLGGDGRRDPDAAEPATARHLALALERLRDGSFACGTTERFDASLLLFAASLGWPPPHYRSHRVATQRIRRDEIDGDTLRVILERNALDLELHRAVAELLDAAIEERGPGFAARLARFRRSNRARLRAAGTATAIGRRLPMVVRRAAGRGRRAFRRRGGTDWR